MRKKMATLIVLLVLASISTVTYAALQYTMFYRQTWNVLEETGMKIYEDSALTTELANNTDIAWGDVGIGTKSKSLWIENIGTVSFTLTLTTEDVPIDYSITWDYSGGVLTPGSVLEVTLTLTVPNSAQATDPNQCDSWIKATQTT